MRKIASILMAILVLLTGIHLSIASHLCQGKLVAVKLSITSENTTSCCMGGNSLSSPSGKIIKKHCCDNGLTTLMVDSDYSPSFAKSIDVAQKIIHYSGIPSTEIVLSGCVLKNCVLLSIMSITSFFMFILILIYFAK